jgi:hypothetical protein
MYFIITAERRSSCILIGILISLFHSIKLASKLNRCYNIGLKFIKIRSNNSNKRNNVVPNPLNWWLKIS